MAHLSTLTHDYFNSAGYADKPFSSFLQKLFSGGYYKNSLIILYSDHGLRFGSATNTTASIHEQRLPFIYIYVPDTLSLNGLNSDQLRSMVKTNQNRLTSHFDLYATMLNVLYGKSPENDPYGKSLFEEIPPNRTCQEAGIKRQYCLCNSYNPIPVSKEVVETSQKVLDYVNSLMASYGNHCIPLTLNSTYRAFDSYYSKLNETYRIVHFKTDPNNALLEGMVQMDSKNMKSVFKIENVSRLSRYGEQSDCISKQYFDIGPFCYCWDKYKKDKGIK